MVFMDIRVFFPVILEFYQLFYRGYYIPLKMRIQPVELDYSKSITAYARRASGYAQKAAGYSKNG
jgi:hypothetical protein